MTRPHSLQLSAVQCKSVSITKALLTFFSVGDRQTASDTFDMILSNDVLVASPGSKKKGFSQTGRPRYQVVDKEPGRSKMMEKFFDPLFKIKHYVWANI